MQGMANLEEKSILEDNIRYSYMSVVWSHKIQEKQSDILAGEYKKLEIVRLICNALTSVGLISLIFTDQFLIKFVATMISFVITLSSMHFKSFDTQNSIINHKKAANELLGIRDKLRILLVKVKLESKDDFELLSEYEYFIKQLDQIYREAPSTTDKAVKKASKALKINGDNSFSTEEIDANLPESLRRK
ncbi:hypothetical protein ACH45_02920 [Ligilactobacillus animalis]|nr:hypothetical protein BFC98_01495 [Ligilactobacillus animalis]THE19971.1 hypothetical protein ACH44_08060 [Ligilactobacillus animalis]THE22151.1 hypothetical protein ACH45_02920 [Ligilactobacillus animalis]